MVAYPADGDSSLLLRLAPYRLLDGLALVDEARQRREHADAYQRPLALAEQAAVAVDDQHDRHGIRARKVAGGAGRAVADVAALALHRPLAAHAAVLMVLVPADLRARLREDAGLWAGQRHRRSSGFLE